MRTGIGWRIGSNCLYQAIALLLMATAASPPAEAKPAYDIDGVGAPQVAPNPLADELKARLRKMVEQIKARSQPFTLNQAMETGLLNNPQLAQAYAQIQGQEWNLIAVRRQWYPSIIASPSRSYVFGQDASSATLKPNEVVGPKRSENTGNTFAGAGIQLTWTFFNPTRGASINAAIENVKQQQLLFDVSARNLALEIQETYFRAQEEEQLMRAYSEILASTNRQVELTEAQFNNGLVSIADVEQIRTQQFSILTTLINAYSKFIAASARLAEVLALTPGRLAQPSENLSPLGEWDQPLQATINQALALREEIQASLAASASASWKATALFNSYWPQFSLGGSGNYVVNDGTWGPQDDRRGWDASIGVSFNWKLFDGGIAAAEAEAQRAAALQASDQAEVLRLRVSREVEQNYANYLTSLLALESTQAQSRSARQAATAVRERFAVGVTDMADVVQSLRQDIDAANAYATAILSYNNAVIALYRSSARWPKGSEPLIKQRQINLRER